MKNKLAVIFGFLFCIIFSDYIALASGIANNPQSGISALSQGPSADGNGGWPFSVVNATGTTLDVNSSPAASVLLGSHTFVGGADTFSVSIINVTEVAVHISGTLTTGNFFVNADNTTSYAGPQGYSVQQVTPGWTSVNNTYFVSPDTWIIPVSGFSTLNLKTDAGFTGNLVVSVNTVTAPSWFNVANAIIVQSGAAHIGTGFGDNESNAANVPINNQYNAVGSQCFPFVFNNVGWDRVRDASSTANTTGTGLTGAGILGYDGTKWQYAGINAGHALKTDGSGITQPVSGTFFQATQPVSIASTVAVSKDITTGRTVVMKTGSLTTTVITPDQVVLTYTVTSGKTLYLEYLTISARFTTLSTTGALMGSSSLENPSGTKGITDTFTNPTIEEPERITIPFSEPLPIASGTVVRVVCTPAGVTSTLWTANFGGYEK